MINKKFTHILSLTITMLFIAQFLVLVEASNRIVEELLLIYNSDQDLNFIVNSGCVVERVFKTFNIVLAYCTLEAREYFKKLGIDVYLNHNVSIYSTVKSFKVFKLESFNHSYQSYVYDSDLGTISIYWSWAISRASSDIAWNYLNEYGAESIIAILDTGIDPRHPLLTGKLIGWIEFDSKGRPVCTPPRDTHGHGTWVASIAAGGDGSTYVFGVAPKAKILSALVLPGGSGTIAQVLAGLEWVLDPYDCRGIRLGKKPDVVSMSFGILGNYSNVLLPAIAKLIENGIVSVAAIGNGGPYTSSNPGNIWGVIGVGAIDLDNDVASFSSYEEVEWPDPPRSWPFKKMYPSRYKKPDLVAPGVDVPGAFPGGLIGIGSGTSAATPIVAGVAAIVSSKLKNQGFYGVKLVEQVYEILTSTTVSIDHPGSGKGLLDAYRAIAVAKKINLTIAEISVHPESIKPLDLVSLNVKGIKQDEQIDVYISGVKVYSGTIPSTPIIVEVPLTHISMNTVVVVSSNGLYYGKNFVYVIPRFIANYTGLWGKKINIIVTGLGIGDSIGVYLDNNLITIWYANLRGSYVSSLLVPYAEEGVYNLTVIDFSLPTIILTSPITIKPYYPDTTRQTQTLNVYNITNVYTLPTDIAIVSKQYYLAESVDYIDIVTHDFTPINITIMKTYPIPVTIDILNITSIHDDVYRIWIKIGYVDTPETHVVMNITLRKEEKILPYTFVVKILQKDPYEVLKQTIENVSRNFAQNLTLLSRIYDEMNNTKSEIKKLDKNLIDISMNIHALNISTRESLEHFDEVVKGIEEKSMRIIYVNILTIAVIGIILAITIYLWYKINRVIA